jgi:hypothetical protein
MGTNVSDVMTARPRCAAPDTPLSEVAQLMEAQDVGAIPVRWGPARWNDHRSRHRPSSNRQREGSARHG